MKNKIKKTKKRLNHGKNNTDQLVLIYCVYPTKIEARRTTRQLLTEKLIVCANIFAPMSSEFVWEGKVCNAKEYGVFFKTLQKKSQPCRKRIKSLHSYQVPVIAEIKLSSVNKEFLEYARKILI